MTIEPIKTVSETIGSGYRNPDSEAFFYRNQVFVEIPPIDGILEMTTPALFQEI